MCNWTLTDWATAVFLTVCAIICIIIGFIRTPMPDSLSDPVATAQAERLIRGLECESELHALQTRVPAMLAVADCTPDATLVYVATSVAPRIAGVERRIGTLEWVQVEAAAILAGGHAVSTPPMDVTPQATVTLHMATSTPTLELAIPTATPRPTMTPDALPTATRTQTPSPMCYPCSETNQACPDNMNYYCARCAAGTWRCVRRTSPSSDCRTCLAAAMPVASPIWLGLAVYHGEQRETASGEPFDGSAMTCAVDVSLFTQFVNRILHICVIPGYGVNEARCVDVRVTDSGPLGRAGLFVYESRPRGMLTVTRWWAGDGDGALPIVVDLTPAAMDMLTGGTRETCAMTVEVLP